MFPQIMNKPRTSHISNNTNNNHKKNTTKKTQQIKKQNIHQRTQPLKLSTTKNKSTGSLLHIFTFTKTQQLSLYLQKAT